MWKHKIVFSFAFMGILFLWTISSPFSFPLNALRFLAIASNLPIKNLGCQSAAKLGEGGSVFFLKVSLSCGGRAPYFIMQCGMKKYISYHGENVELNRHILDVFIANYESSNNVLYHDVYIDFIYSEKRKTEPKIVLAMIDIYENHFTDEDKARARRNSNRSKIEYFRKEGIEHKDADDTFWEEKSRKQKEEVQKYDEDMKQRRLAAIAKKEDEERQQQTEDANESASEQSQ